MKRSIFLGVIASLTTLSIAPHIFFDPINFPKFLVLTLGVSLLFLTLLFNHDSSLRLDMLPIRKTNAQSIVIYLLFFLLVTIIVLSFAMNEYERDTQLLGTWGRNTGVILWISLLAICLLSYLFLNDTKDFEFIEKTFIRCSYAVYSYALIQIAELDPIKWSSLQPTSFLGNINFVSAFLGMAATLLFSITLFRKLPFQTVVFYLLICTLYLIYMFTTNSLQGLACFLVGTFVSILVKLRGKLQRGVLTGFTILSGSFLGLLALSVFGVGPLGSFLQQQTLAFRLDYWLAGVEMIRANHYFGVGLDNYGSYYREYRSAIAATSTGPDRVTNTAHNIFIDFGVGTGFAGFILLFALFVLGLLSAIKRLTTMGFLESKSKVGSTSDKVVKSLPPQSLLTTFLSVTVSYFVFMLISINQIGVSVWGFLFLGGLLRLGQLKSEAKLEKAPRERSRTLKHNFILAIILCISFSMIIFKVAPAAKIDYQFLRLLNAKDFVGLLDLAQEDSTTSTYYEVAIEEAVRNRTVDRDALLLHGKLLLEEDSRNFYALSLLLNLETDPVLLTKYARRITALDPKNEQLRVWLDK